MINKTNKNEVRSKKHYRIRNKISGTGDRPRLSVYRSTTNIYAQIIDDTKGNTLVSASSLDKDLTEKIKGKTKSEIAGFVGERLAKLAKSKKIKAVIFDRGGYLYTGRVKVLADAARNAGLEF